MLLDPQEIPPVPEETRRVAQAAFPRGRARTRRASGAVACAGLATLGWRKRTSSMSSPRWPSTWCGWARGGWGRPQPTRAARPSPLCGGPLPR
jgi:hypothetical protein